MMFRKKNEDLNFKGGFYKCREKLHHSEKKTNKITVKRDLCCKYREKLVNSKRSLFDI